MNVDSSFSSGTEQNMAFCIIDGRACADAVYSSYNANNMGLRRRCEETVQKISLSYSNRSGHGASAALREVLVFNIFSIQLYHFQRIICSYSSVSFIYDLFVVPTSGSNLILIKAELKLFC